MKIPKNSFAFQNKTMLKTKYENGEGLCFPKEFTVRCFKYCFRKQPPNRSLNYLLHSFEYIQTETHIISYIASSNNNKKNTTKQKTHQQLKRERMEGRGVPASEDEWGARERKGWGEREVAGANDGRRGGGGDETRAHYAKSEDVERRSQKRHSGVALSVGFFLWCSVVGFFYLYCAVVGVNLGGGR